MSNLITLHTYKQAKAIMKSDSDERLNIIIEGVSQLIKTYCGISFIDYVTNPKTEYHNVKSQPLEEIQLEEFPIINISSVRERTSPEESYETLTKDVDYIVDSTVDTIVRIDGYFPKGHNSVEVIYTAGYVDGAGEALVPADIKLATIDLVTYYFKEEHKKQQSLGSTTKQNVSGTSIKNDTGFPDHIRRVLDMYRDIG